MSIKGPGLTFSGRQAPDALAPSCPRGTRACHGFDVLPGLVHVRQNPILKDSCSGP